MKKLLTRKQKLEVCEKMLYRFKEDPPAFFYLCTNLREISYELFNVELDANHEMETFKEFLKYKPVNKGYVWWNVNNEGLQSRIHVIEQVIKDLKRNLSKDRPKKKLIDFNIPPNKSQRLEIYKKALEIYSEDACPVYRGFCYFICHAINTTYNPNGIYLNKWSAYNYLEESYPEIYKYKPTNFNADKSAYWFPGSEGKQTRINILKEVIEELNGRLQKN